MQIEQTIPLRPNDGERAMQVGAIVLPRHPTLHDIDQIERTVAILREIVEGDEAALGAAGEENCCRWCGQRIPPGAWIGPGRPDAWLCVNIPIDVQGRRGMRHEYICPKCKAS